MSDHTLTVPLAKQSIPTASYHGSAYRSDPQGLRPASFTSGPAYLYGAIGDGRGAEASTSNRPGPFWDGRSEAVHHDSSHVLSGGDRFTKDIYPVRPTRSVSQPTGPAAAYDLSLYGPSSHGQSFPERNDRDDIDAEDNEDDELPILTPVNLQPDVPSRDDTSNMVQVYETSASDEVQACDVGSRAGSGSGSGSGSTGAPTSTSWSWKRFSWRKLWSFTGPGWLMSIAYLDPGNLESDLQAGATTGYALIWVLFWATVLGLVFQILAARLGVVTGRDLAQLCRAAYPRWAAYIVWAMTEIAIIGSDIQEVVGSAIAMNILFGMPLWAGVLVTAADTFTFLLIHYFGVRKLEALFASLIAIMAGCFIAQFAIGRPDGVELMKGWAVPTVPHGAWVQAVGMLGAIIMPHNLFLHSSLVQSRAIDHKNKAQVEEAVVYFTIEAAVSLAVSFVINLCVVAVFAKGFYGQGPEASDIGLSVAGDKLEAVFGSAARTVWAVGLLAAGQSSTMTGTFAGQFVMQGFLDLKIAPWMRTLFTRSVALVPALVVAVLANRDMDALSEYINVIQSIQLPFALLPVIVFSSSERIVGDFKLGRKVQLTLWAMVLLVLATNVYIVISFAQDNFENAWWVWALLACFAALYLSFIGYLSLRSHWRRAMRRAGIDKACTKCLRCFLCCCGRVGLEQSRSFRRLELYLERREAGHNEDDLAEARGDRLYSDFGHQKLPDYHAPHPG